MTETDDAMTETDSGITESYNEMGKGVGTNTNNDDITRVITNGYEDITRGYNAGTRDYDSITRGYRREREGAGTIGLD